MLTVDGLKVEKDTLFWGSELAGFGVRVHPTGRMVCVVETRAGGKAAKRVTIGRHDVITAAEARRRAARAIARIKAGKDPVAEPLAEGPTVGKQAEFHLEEHVAVHCKPKTEAMYRLAVANHILLRHGRRPALAVGHRGVTELHYALSAKPVLANHVVDMLSRIYNLAEDRRQLSEMSSLYRSAVKKAMTATRSQSSPQAPG